MPTYLYKARDENGKPIQASMDAPSQDDLAGKLRKMGYMPVQIREALPGINMESLGSRLRRIKSEDIILFNIQLANMIDSGLTIITSLRIISEQIENKKLKGIIEDVGRLVEAGSSLSDALAKHPRVFPKIFIHTVRAGETSGKLNLVLNRLAVYVEQQEELRQKVKGAFFYPMILLFAGLLVIILIVTFIIPQFVEIFKESNVPLPVPTIIVYELGVGLKKAWYLVILGLGLAVFGMRKYVETKMGRLWFDRMQISVPVIGPLVRKVIISRFSRTLATLVESGVSILQSLDIVRDVVGNGIIGRIVQNVRDSVERGDRIAEPLRVSEEFPLDAVQMIAVGEETGKLGYMLNKIADLYDTSIKFSVRKMTMLIEPVLLVVLGVVVGFIMASMLLPMFDMIKTLRS
jgi:type IV pilus assembly protein PilC